MCLIFISFPTPLTTNLLISLYHKPQVRRYANTSRKCFKSMEQELRQSGQSVIVTIFTDGRATDGDVSVALRPLSKLPVRLVIRLCTDDTVLLTTGMVLTKTLKCIWIA